MNYLLCDLEPWKAQTSKGPKGPGGFPSMSALVSSSRRDGHDPGCNGWMEILIIATTHLLATAAMPSVATSVRYCKCLTATLCAICSRRLRTQCVPPQACDGYVICSTAPAMDSSSAKILQRDTTQVESERRAKADAFALCKRRSASTLRRARTLTLRLEGPRASRTSCREAPHQSLLAAKNPSLFQIHSMSRGTGATCTPGSDAHPECVGTTGSSASRATPAQAPPGAR